MPMKASDLTYEEKQRLLSQIRDQTGKIEYDRLVDVLGEDGLIDFVLEKTSGTTNASAVSSRGSRSTIGKRVWRAIQIVLWVAGCSIILWLSQQKDLEPIFNCVCGFISAVLALISFIEWLAKPAE